MVETVSKARENSRNSGVEPYHLFTVLGEHFIFDTTGCRFYQIDEISADFLSLALRNPIQQAKLILKNTKKYTDHDVELLYEEILFLEQNGLFDVPNSYINLSDAENTMQQTNIKNGLVELQLLLAENCNLACRYCYCSITRDLPEQGLMDIMTAKSAIDLALQQDISRVAITMFGGEPLLNKPVIDFIMEYTPVQAEKINKKPHYVITTNATLLDEKTINYIVDYNFGLMVSMDGPKELHDNQCPTKTGKGSFDLAAKNIKELMKHRTVGVRATMTHPVPDLRKLINFFLDFGFYPLCICSATSRLETPQITDCTEDDYSQLIEQIEGLLPWMLEYLKRGKIPPYFPQDVWCEIIANNRMSADFWLFNCGAGHGKCAVDAQGIMYPCAKFAGMANWQVGNVHQGLDTEKVKKMWLDFLKCIEPVCGKCWAYPVCHGPCI